MNEGGKIDDTKGIKVRHTSGRDAAWTVEMPKLQKGRNNASNGGRGARKSVLNLVTKGNNYEFLNLYNFYILQIYN